MEHHLITGATTARAQQIARKFQSELVWMSDCVPIPDVLKRSGRYLQLSDIKSSTYIHELLKACLDVDARYLHLVRVEEAGLLAPHTGLFEEYGIEIVLDSLT